MIGVLNDSRTVDDFKMGLLFALGLSFPPNSE